MFSLVVFIHQQEVLCPVRVMMMQIQMDHQFLYLNLSRKLFASENIKDVEILKLRKYYECETTPLIVFF